MRSALKDARCTRTASASEGTQTNDRGRHRLIMPLTNSLVGYLAFWAEGLENKVCQGDVFKGAWLIYPGPPSVLTSAFCTVQLSHPYRPILSFDLFISTPLKNRKLHNQGDIPTQEYHRTPKGAHTAWLQSQASCELWGSGVPPCSWVSGL